jgi:hypothetical protein
LLAALAFFTGLAVRFQKDTKTSLIEALKAKAAVNSAPAVPLQPVDPPAAK